MDSLYSIQKRFSVLARLDRKYFNLANRIRLARFLVRASVKQNLKYLMGINLNELKRQRPKQPDEDARAYFQELTEEAQSGPIFTEEALMAVQQAGDSLPKEKAKTLANLISKDENPDLSSLDLVLQWLMVNDPSSDSMTYTQVADAAHNASEDALEAPAPVIDPYDPRTSEEGKKLIVYRFPDGYFITQVPVGGPREREGTLMDNCVKNVHKENTTITILSLRDPHNKPHVDISLSNPGGEILELRGKQNKAPIPKYMKYVREFIGSGGIKENVIYWALFNREKFEESLTSSIPDNLLESAINQTPFVDLITYDLSRRFPLASVSNIGLDDSTRDRYVNGSTDRPSKFNEFIRAGFEMKVVRESVIRVVGSMKTSKRKTRLSDSLLLRLLGFFLVDSLTPEYRGKLEKIRERDKDRIEPTLEEMISPPFRHLRGSVGVWPYILYLMQKDKELAARLTPLWLGRLEGDKGYAEDISEAKSYLEKLRSNPVPYMKGFLELDPHVRVDAVRASSSQAAFNRAVLLTVEKDPSTIPTAVEYLAFVHITDPSVGDAVGAELRKPGVMEKSVTSIPSHISIDEWEQKYPGSGEALLRALSNVDVATSHPDLILARAPSEMEDVPAEKVKSFEEVVPVALREAVKRGNSGLSETSWVDFYFFSGFSEPVLQDLRELLGRDENLTREIVRARGLLQGPGVEIKDRDIHKLRDLFAEIAPSGAGHEANDSRILMWERTVFHEGDFNDYQLRLLLNNRAVRDRERRSVVLHYLKDYALRGYEMPSYLSRYVRNRNKNTPSEKLTDSLLSILSPGISRTYQHLQNKDYPKVKKALGSPVFTRARKAFLKFGMEEEAQAVQEFARLAEEALEKKGKLSRGDLPDALRVPSITSKAYSYLSGEPEPPSAVTPMEDFDF